MITKLKAQRFDSRKGAFVTANSDYSQIIPIADFEKREYEYKGMVYDLELERNHIMLIRRSGKTFWGSNCRCVATPITLPQAEISKLYDKYGSREEIMKHLPLKGTIERMPDCFNKWVKENAKRIERADERGTLPYFLRDNRGAWAKIIQKSNEQRTEEFFNAIEYDVTKQTIKDQKPKYDADFQSELMTEKSINKIIAAFAESNPKFFNGKFAGVKFNDNLGNTNNAMMGTKTIIQNDGSKSISIHISKCSFGVINNYGKVENYIPAISIRSAFKKIALGEKLEFHEEYSIESLWHEMLHASAKGWGIEKNLQKQYMTNTMEVVNQLCARTTYPYFLKSIGGKANFVNDVLEYGYGYKDSVTNMRKLFNLFAIDEKKFVQEFLGKIQNTNYENVYKQVLQIFPRDKMREYNYIELLDNLKNTTMFNDLFSNHE